MTVTPFRPGSVIVEGADSDVVEMCERLLSEAKGGRLIGLAVATYTKAGAHGTEWTGQAGVAHHLTASVAMLSHRIAAALLGGGA